MFASKITVTVIVSISLKITVVHLSSSEALLELFGSLMSDVD